MPVVEKVELRMLRINNTNYLIIQNDRHRDLREPVLVILYVAGIFGCIRNNLCIALEGNTPHDAFSHWYLNGLINHIVLRIFRPIRRLLNQHIALFVNHINYTVFKVKFGDTVPGKVPQNFVYRALSEQRDREIVNDIFDIFSCARQSVSFYSAPIYYLSQGQVRNKHTKCDTINLCDS